MLNTVRPSSVSVPDTVAVCDPQAVPDDRVLAVIDHVERQPWGRPGKRAADHLEIKRLPRLEIDRVSPSTAIRPISNTRLPAAPLSS